LQGSLRGGEGGEVGRPRGCKKREEGCLWAAIKVNWFKFERCVKADNFKEEKGRKRLRLSETQAKEGAPFAASEMPNDGTPAVPIDDGRGVGRKKKGATNDDETKEKRERGWNQAASSPKTSVSF